MFVDWFGLVWVRPRKRGSVARLAQVGCPAEKSAAARCERGPAFVDHWSRRLASSWLIRRPPFGYGSAGLGGRATRALLGCEENNVEKKGRRTSRARRRERARRRRASARVARRENSAGREKNLRRGAVNRRLGKLRSGRGLIWSILTACSALC
jgi:hypothetical protein